MKPTDTDQPVDTRCRDLHGCHFLCHTLTLSKAVVLPITRMTDDAWPRMDRTCDTSLPYGERGQVPSGTDQDAATTDPRPQSSLLHPYASTYANIRYGHTLPTRTLPCGSCAAAPVAFRHRPPVGQV